MPLRVRNAVQIYVVVLVSKVNLDRSEGWEVAVWKAVLRGREEFRCVERRLEDEGGGLEERRDRLGVSARLVSNQTNHCLGYH